MSRVTQRCPGVVEDGCGSARRTKASAHLEAAPAPDAPAHRSWALASPGNVQRRRPRTHWARLQVLGLGGYQTRVAPVLHRHGRVPSVVIFQRSSRQSRSCASWSHDASAMGALGVRPRQGACLDGCARMASRPDSRQGVAIRQSCTHVEERCSCNLESRCNYRLRYNIQRK